MSAGVLAAVKVDIRKTELREFVMPNVPADAGLLRVEAVGVCGTDVHTYHEQLSNGPFIMGHENVGRIARLGPVAAQRWGLQEGDLVLAEGYRVCGHCESCLSGYFGYCPREGGEESPEDERPDSLIRFQPSRGGGFSQYLYLHPESRFHRIPQHVSVEQATLALPFGNGWQWAYLDGGVSPGKTVLIQGPGQQGLGCVVASREAGAGRIIVSGLASDEKRLEVARRLGADFTINVEKEDLIHRVKVITGGRGVDLVLDVATGTSSTLLPAIEVLAVRGTLVVVPRGGKIADFPMDVVHQKSLTLKCVRGHSYQAVEMAIRVIAAGKYPLKEVTSHKFGLWQVDAAIRAVEGEGPKDVIHVTVDPWWLSERP
jgi:threonine dehydrogenase-like Zn-dependent dehydrogenase